MRIQLTCLSILLTFFFEVINPSTSFVREQGSHLNKLQKIAKIEKSKSTGTSHHHQAPQTVDDDDYVSGGAVVPMHRMLEAPTVLVTRIDLKSVKPPQSVDRGIHRPPQALI